MGSEEPQEGKNLVIDHIDSALLDPRRLHSLLAGEGTSNLGGGGFNLDTSLERVFGSGATMLAIEFEGGIMEESVGSEDEENMSVSTPIREDARNKRHRRGGCSDKFGDISGIAGVHELSDSEGSEDASGDVKKPRLGTEDDAGFEGYQPGPDITDGGDMGA